MSPFSLHHISARALLVFLFCLAATTAIIIGNLVAEAVAPSFAAKQDVTVNSRPYKMAVGDLNRDGKPDLVVGYAENTTAVSVLLNSTSPGATSTSFSVKQDFVVGDVPTGVALADINGDGSLDLIVAVRNNGKVSVLLNTTAPGAAAVSFAAKQDFPGGIAPLVVTPGDLNGDGRPDLAVVNECGGCDTVSVLLNTTTPGSTTVSLTPKMDFPTGTNPKTVVMGDLNNDGKLDLAVANTLPGNGVSVFINTMAPGATTPSFAVKQDVATPNALWAADVFDVNGDGKLDLATANGSGSVSVMVNTTAPGSATVSFATRADFSTPGLEHLIVSDFNGDGRPDVAGAGTDVNRLVVLMNTTAPGSTTPSFATAQQFPTGTGPIFCATSDLNLDGKSDLLTANITNLSLSVFLNTTNQGPATPGFTPELPFGVNQSAGNVVMGDLNLDGKRDMVVTLADHTVSIFCNTTPSGANTPSFATHQDITSFTTPFSSAIGDLNGDGKPDLAVANFDSASVSVFLNTTTPGATTFSFAARQEFPTGNWQTGVAIGDVNGDGKLDLAISNGASSTISVLLNTTATGDLVPSFATHQDFATGTSPMSVVLADLNGDGRVDLAVANRDTDSVSVLLNTTAAGATTPSFSAKQDFTTATSPRSLAVGDLNLDGKLDLIVSSSGGGNDLVSVLLNNTTPGAATTSFATKQDFATGVGAAGVTLGDLNGDGKLDIAVANTTDNNVSVFVNATSPGATTLSFAARRNFNTGNGPGFVSVGDLNGDGKPDLAVANGVAHSVSVLLNAPAITPATGLTRQQGSPASNSQIATVTSYGGDSSVNVTVTSANPANGVTISNIVNTGGNITADVVAGCAATSASFTLQASDGGSSMIAILNVAVTSNTAPTVTYTNPAAIAFKGATTVTLTSASDNGSISSYSVFSVTPALTTVPTVNSAGVVSITNAQPAGNHTVTIRATDNCGATTNSSFVLAVNKADTTTAVSSSLNPALLGQSVTFSATVSSTGGTPTGTVQFKIDGVNVGSPVTLSGSGVAQLGTSSLTAGTHTVAADYNGDANFNTSSGSLAGGQVVNNRPLIGFSPTSYNVGESAGFVTITVIRSGDTAPPVTVDYSTSGNNGLPCSNATGIATPKCDFTAAVGTLAFAAGETNKTITVLISQDSFVEGPETFSLSLSSATPGAGIASPSTATVNLADDATEPSTNIIDDPNQFVRMHYHDFLNREGDQAGIDFWTGQMTNCGTSDLTVCRVNVSGAFFLSIEFQQTGYLVERMYKTAYGDATGTSTLGGSHQLNVPVVRFNEFLKDTQRIGQGVVVLAPGWEQALENNKQAYAGEFVATSRFISAFPTTMMPAQFVDKLNQNAGNVLSSSERTTAINLFSGAADSSNTTARAQALRQVAEDPDLFSAEFNRAFVLTEFFGYLRRNPNDLPDSDYTGYEFWLTKLNQFNGDYIGAEMVKAFIASSEYRQRFGP